jgi:hypothetical protein
MLGTAEEQHPLGHRRLAGVDVSDDSDVSKVLNFPRHLFSIPGLELAPPASRRKFSAQIQRTNFSARTLAH